VAGAVIFLLEHDLFRKPVPTFRDHAQSMIFSENRFPPRITSGAGFFGIMFLTE